MLSFFAMNSGYRQYPVEQLLKFVVLYPVKHGWSWELLVTCAVACVVEAYALQEFLVHAFAPESCASSALPVPGPHG